MALMSNRPNDELPPAVAGNLSRESRQASACSHFDNQKLMSVTLASEDYRIFVEWLHNDASITFEARWYLPTRCQNCGRLVGLAAGPAQVNLTLPYVVEVETDGASPNDPPGT